MVYIYIQYIILLNIAQSTLSQSKSNQLAIYRNFLGRVTHTLHNYIIIYLFGPFLTLIYPLASRLPFLAKKANMATLKAAGNGGSPFHIDEDTKKFTHTKTISHRCTHIINRPGVMCHVSHVRCQVYLKLDQETWLVPDPIG